MGVFTQAVWEVITGSVELLEELAAIMRQEHEPFLEKEQVVEANTNILKQQALAKFTKWRAWLPNLPISQVGRALYEMLQKYGVRLETITERFSDGPGGELALSYRATNAKLEREQSYLRMQRGKMDRIEIGNAPNGHPKPAYGYIFVDSKTEQKGRYGFNLTIIHIDSTGTKWSEYTVVLFIFDLRERGTSLGKVADILNELGVPPPHQAYKYRDAAHWQRGTMHRIVGNPIYTGEVWANRYKSVKSARTGKLSMVLRPRSEWVLLPEGTASAIVSKETFEAVQRQMECNKEDSYRNNNHPKEELGLLRSGFIFCGVCGNRACMSPIPRKRSASRVPIPGMLATRETGQHRSKDVTAPKSTFPILTPSSARRLTRCCPIPCGCDAGWRDFECEPGWLCKSQLLRKPSQPLAVP